MLVEIFLILFCVLIFWIHSLFVRRNYSKLINDFESIGPLYPIIGHYYIIFGKSYNEMFYAVTALGAKCKKTATLWIFSKLIILVNTPQDVQTVLNSTDCLEKGKPYKRMWTGAAIITSHASRWKPQRRLLNPNFNLKTTMTFVPKITEIACNLVKDLEPYCDQGEILLLDKIGIRTLETSIINLFGNKLDDESLNESYHIMNEIFDIFSKRILGYYHNMIYAYLEKLLKIVSKDFHLLYRQLVLLDGVFLAGKQKHMPEIEKDALTISSEEQLRNKPDGFLKRMYRMAFHNRITEAESTETILTVLYAATDTTTRAISNIILCLAMNPNIQEKLYDELKNMLDDTEPEITDYDKILKVQYLDCVIKESLRFLPVAPAIARCAIKNIQLEHGIIPAGTDIIILTDNIHKNESIWGSNCNKFDPDNFLPENCAKRHPCSFLPFSYGPRNCIGYRYAQVSMKITITNLVRKYKFGTSLRPENLTFGFGLTSILLNDYRISVTKRSGF